jgi:hypothetical protein
VSKRKGKVNSWFADCKNAKQTLEIFAKLILKLNDNINCVKISRLHCIAILSISLCPSGFFQTIKLKNAYFFKVRFKHHSFEGLATF